MCGCSTPPAASGTPAQSAVASANTGQTITLGGAGLRASDTVVFSSRDGAGTLSTQGVTPASVAADGTSLTVVVPTNATSGMVRLAGEQAGVFLQVVPTLADADISSLYHGGTLALRGTGFAEGSSTVHFGAQSLADSGPISGIDVFFGVAQENDRLNVVVPNGVPLGPITVTTLGGTSAALVRSFTGIVGVAGSGTAADSAQASANPGQAIVLQGVGLDLTTDVLFQTIDSAGNVGERIVRGTAVNAAGTELTVLVPVDGLTGAVAVVGDQHNTQALLQVVPVITRADLTSVAGNGTSAQVQLRGAGFVEDRASEYSFGATVVRDDSVSSGPDVFFGFAQQNDAVNLTLPLSGDYDGAVTVKTAGGTSAPFSVGFTALQSTALSGTPADAAQASANPGQTITLVGTGLTTSLDIIARYIDTSGNEIIQLFNPATAAADGRSATFAVPTRYNGAFAFHVFGAEATPLLQIVPLVTLVDVTGLSGSSSRAQLQGRGFVEGHGSVYSFGTGSVTDTDNSGTPIDVFFGFTQENDAVNLTLPASGPGTLRVTTAGGTSAPIAWDLYSPNAGTLRDLAFSSSELLVADGAVIRRLNPDTGVELGSFDIPFTTTSSRVGLQILPTAMTLGGTAVPAGSLLVINGGASNDRIIALNPVTGAQLAALDLGQNLDPDAGAFHPGTGELLLLDDGPNVIVRVNPATGAVLGSFAVPFGGANAGLAIHPTSGNLWIASSAANEIVEMTTAGVEVRRINVAPLSIANELTGLAFRDADELFASSSRGVIYFIPDPLANAAADLQVTDLRVEPESLVSGNSVTVRWNDANAGAGATRLSWYDRITVRNTGTGQLLLDDVLFYDRSTLGDLAAGASAARSYSFALPGGTAGAGLLEFTVVADHFNTLLESQEGNNSATVTRQSSPGNIPDLQLTGLSLEPSSGLRSGDAVTIHWSDLNGGTGPVIGSWTDRVVIFNATTGQTLGERTVFNNVGVDGPLAAGAARARSVQFELPDGMNGVGTLEFRLTTDSTGALFELNEANNDATITAASTLADYVDLQVGTLTVSGALQSGTDLTIAWSDVNTGTAPVAGSWHDLVSVVNSSTGETLLHASVIYDPAAASHQQVLHLPDGPRSVGTLRITVTADSAHEVAEFNATDTAETNNQAERIVASTLAPYPDLVVTDWSVPAGPFNTNQAQFDVSWTVRNQGSGATQASWVDRVLLSPDDIIGDGDDITIANFVESVPLAAGADYSRTRTVTLTANLDGTFYLFLRTDAANALVEFLGTQSGETNNTSTPLPVTLTAHHADLEVRNLVVAPSSPQSGNVVTLTWNDLNTGDFTSGAYTDAVIVRNTTTGVQLVSASVAAASVAAGGSAPRQYSFTLPDGNAGVGDLVITITADSSNAVSEKNAAGTGETNNTATTTATAVIANYPDLSVQNLSIAPASPVSGNTLTITWNDANSGNRAANASWYDLVQVVNTTTGETLLSTTLYHNAVTEGGVAAGGSLARSYSYTLPNASRGAGELRVNVTADYYNHEFEYNTSGTAETNNSATATVTSALAAYPDLSVQNLSVAPASPLSGDTLTITWNDANSGNRAANASWYDLVQVVNITTDQTLLSTALYHNAATEGAVAAGSSLARSYSYTLPNGAAGAGELRVTVTADYYNHEFEFNGAGTAETNNTATRNVSASVAAYPDLQVQGLSLSGTAQSGRDVTINWQLLNSGNAATAGSFYDRVVVVNQDTNATLVNTFVLYNGSAIGAGESRDRSYAFRLPDGLNGAGHLLITVTADGGAAVFEYNSAGTGESNNSASITAESTLAAYANLAVTDIAAPASALSGRSIELSWTVANSGTAAASGGWSDQIFLSSDANPGGDTFLGSFFYASNALDAGHSVTRTEHVTLPSFLTGNQWIVVRTDAGNAVFELNEADNIAADDTLTNIGSSLNLVVVPESVGEAAGSSAATATITRSGGTSSALTVNLQSSITGVTLPASVVIPAGQSAFSFAVGVVNNNLDDGNRTATITASAAGFADGTDGLTVIDDDAPTLALSAPLPSISESYGPLTITVTRNTDTTQALSVDLVNSRPNKLIVPSSVMIAAGEASATFTVTPVNDTLAEGDRMVDLSANAAGFAGGGVRVQVLDDDIPTLTLHLSTAVVAEGAGAAALHGTLTRSIVTDSQIRAALSGDIGRVRVPTYVIFQAGQASVDFDIAVTDNDLADGDHTVTIGASLTDAFTSALLSGTRVEKSLLITDNDGPTLTLTIDHNVLAEAAGAGAATATVTRNTATGTDLTVFLTTTDSTEATVQSSVVILAGHQSASFAVNAVQDGIQDGTQNVTLTASAATFNSASVALQVTDRELPDLQVASVSLPAETPTGSTIGVSWTVNNAGLGAAGSTWTDSVYVSSDSVLSPDDQLVGSFAGSTPLANGDSYTKSITITVGNVVGRMWMFVVTDSGGTVTELSEGNNVRATSMVVT